MPDLKTKSIPAEMRQDGDPYKFTAIISSDTLDRDDEVLLPSGMISNEFDLSGMVLWNHDANKPIGVPGRPRIVGNAVECGGTWLKRPDDWEGEWFPDYARAVAAQAKALGKSLGVSVGFIPRANRLPSKKDIDTWGPTIKNVVTRWSLMEFSIAPLQCNPTAVITAVGKGLVSRESIKACFPDVVLPDVSRRHYILEMPADQKPEPSESIASKIAKAAKLAWARKCGEMYA